MIFRLSQKLAAKLKEGRPFAVAAAGRESLCRARSAHLFTADRTQYIIISNTKSLYSVVLYGRGITDSSQFIDRSLSVREFLPAEDDRAGIRLPAVHCRAGQQQRPVCRCR